MGCCSARPRDGGSGELCQGKRCVFVRVRTHASTHLDRCSQPFPHPPASTRSCAPPYVPPLPPSSTHASLAGPRELDLVSVRDCGRERVCVGVSEFALVWALRDHDGGLQQTFRSSSSPGSLPRALPLWQAERIRKRKRAKRVARRERRKSDCLDRYLYQIAPAELLGGTHQTQADCT